MCLYLAFWGRRFGGFGLFSLISAPPFLLNQPPFPFGHGFPWDNGLQLQSAPCNPLSLSLASPLSLLHISFFLSLHPTTAATAATPQTVPFLPPCRGAQGLHSAEPIGCSAAGLRLARDRHSTVSSAHARATGLYRAASDGCHPDWRPIPFQPRLLYCCQPGAGRQSCPPTLQTSGLRHQRIRRPQPGGAQAPPTALAALPCGPLRRLQGPVPACPAHGRRQAGPPSPCWSSSLKFGGVLQILCPKLSLVLLCWVGWVLT